MTMNEPGSAPDLEPHQRRQLVRELLDRRRTRQARALVAEGLRHDPEDLEMLVLGARVDWLEDRDQEAASGAREVLRRDPTHVEARLLLLAVLTHLGDLPAAEEVALSLLREMPQEPSLFVAYSRVMLRALQVEKAGALAREALRLAPDDADALRACALCDLVSGQRGADSEALQRLLAGHPDDLRTLAVVVTALHQAGRHRAALHCARQLLKADPANPHWVGLVRELQVTTHWSLWPLWPMQRFGWGASVALWALGILAVRMLGPRSPVAGAWLSGMIFTYAVYSWVWPPLLRKWLSRG